MFLQRIPWKTLQVLQDLFILDVHDKLICSKVPGSEVVKYE